MKKMFLISSLLVATVAFASQTFVIGEMFTTTTCGFCIPARSALAEFYDEIEDYPYFIPLIWQGNGPHISPDYVPRRNLYGITGIPSLRFGGNIVVHGYSSDAQYQRYVTAYQRVVARDAPMEIQVLMEENEEQELVVAADVVMTSDIDTPDNHIIFVLTYNLDGIMDPDYFASVKHYHTAEFKLTDEEEQEQYIHNIPLDEDWEMERINVVVFVQSLDSDNPVIHQAGQRPGSGLSSMFTSNVVQGPPSLQVQFSNESLPAHLINSFAWDLTGDGIIDSNEEDPLFIYNEPGTYAVTLTVSDGAEETVLTLDEYITVTEPDNVSGMISSHLKHEFSPYLIVDDVFIPEDGVLYIDPGVKIQVSDSEIIVEGNLKIEANNDWPVKFFSDLGWKGMRLIDSDRENVIKNAIFTDAYDTALIVENSSVDVFSNNMFTTNENRQGTAVLTIHNSELDINNSLVVNNTGHQSAILEFTDSTVQLINNTISHNTFYHDQGSYIMVEDTQLFIKNSIIRGICNIVENIGGGITLAEYSNIEGGFDGLFIFDQEPLFVNPTDEIGADFDGLNAVWYLSNKSPCIDAGNPAPEYSDPEDPDNPGYAMFPAMGTIRNDVGAFGGNGAVSWVGIDNDYQLIRPEMMTGLFTYPNPFNPEVNISLENLTFNDKQPITLKIYDVKGRLVKTIVDEKITNSRHFLWDGQDNHNRRSSSGIYFIRFTTKDISETRKIMMLQ